MGMTFAGFHRTSGGHMVPTKEDHRLRVNSSLAPTSAGHLDNILEYGIAHPQGSQVPQAIDNQYDDAALDEFFDFESACSDQQDFRTAAESQRPDVEPDEYPNSNLAPTGAALAPPMPPILQTSVAAPTARVQPTPSALGPISPASSRHQCNVCGKTYGRKTELTRHAKKHDPNARLYSCPEPTCKFSGMNGMLRRDKMRKHQARFGH